jgi:ABC-type uncharacterized transport system, auxiliary component
MIRSICIFSASLVLLLATGCSVLNPGPPATNVLLPVSPSVSPHPDRLPMQLLVTRPVTNGATETDRIMALMNGYEVRALDSARWVSPIPVLIQRHLVDALDASRRFTSVNWEGNNIEDNYRISTDIRRFFLRYDTPGSPPVADVSIVFSLVRSDSGKIVARTHMQLEEPCQENTVEAFVSTFGRIMTGILSQTVDWVVENMEPKPEKQKRKRR